MPAGPGTPLPEAAPEFEAVVLAGGRGRRLGGADKPGLRVRTGTLVANVVAAAVGAGARRVILVGPPRPELLPITAGLPGGLTVVREDPPGSGPIPALRCGLAAVRAPWAAVLAADLPFLRDTELRALLRAQHRPAGAVGSSAGEPGPNPPAAGAAAGGAAGAVLVDDEDRPQWLVSCWRTEVLRTVLATYRGASLHWLLAPLHPELVSRESGADQPPPWLDCDWPADLDLARQWAQAPGGTLQPSPRPPDDERR